MYIYSRETREYKLELCFGNHAQDQLTKPDQLD